MNQAPHPKPIDTVVQDLRGLLSTATPGTWTKGRTTHHTVSERQGEKPYPIAEFHHANDAAFCDFAHNFIPQVLDALDAANARIAQLDVMLGGAETRGKMVLDAKDDWRRLALQFDGHRMQALGHLKTLVQIDNGYEAAQAAEAFLAAPPLAGEAVLAQRIAELAAQRPRESLQPGSEQEPAPDTLVNTVADGLFEHQEWGGYVPAMDRAGFREIVGTIIDTAALQAAPPAPEAASALERLRAITLGIDQEETADGKGWWETSTGAEFGRKTLAELELLVSALAAPPALQATPASAETLYLLRRLLSNQHTFTGSEFRAELTKIVDEACRTQAPPAPAAVAVLGVNEAGYLPCPFCGSDDVSLSLGETGDCRPWHYVECGQCAGNSEPERWNERAALAAAPAQAVAVPSDALENVRVLLRVAKNQSNKAGMAHAIGVVQAEVEKAAARIAAPAQEHATQLAGQGREAQAVQWRNITKVVRALADFCFGSKDDPQWGIAHIAIVNSLTAKDGLDVLALGLEPLPAAPAQAQGQHADDEAVDALAAVMKAKLALQRAEGYGGWNTEECTQQRLSDMLRAHVDKGDPVDVANFCAFLEARREGIAPAPAQAQAHDQPTAYFGLAAEQIDKLRTSGLKPDEIAGEDPAAQLNRVRELVWRFARFADGHANPKWLRGHAFELAYYIACMDVKRGIDLEPVKKAAFKEGAMISANDRAMLERLGILPTPAQEDAQDAVRALIATHADMLEDNAYAYFELAYTRQTGWMAWITDKPLYGAPVVNPDRKVLAQGQGGTPDEACADAITASAGQQADEPDLDAWKCEKCHGTGIHEFEGYGDSPRGQYPITQREDCDQCETIGWCGPDAEAAARAAKGGAA